MRLDENNQTLDQLAYQFACFTAACNSGLEKYLFTYLWIKSWRVPSIDNSANRHHVLFNLLL